MRERWQKLHQNLKMGWYDFDCDLSLIMTLCSLIDELKKHKNQQIGGVSSLYLTSEHSRRKEK